MKKIIFIIFSLILSAFSYGNNQYLEFADIPDTDIINFNGDFEGTIYDVSVDTGTIYYVEDNGIHNCFKLVGTGYTEKLGEIYFQYNGTGSFLCDDYKLRGVFKIQAGGRGHMNDSNGTRWQIFLDKISKNGYYFHNGDNNGGGTGQAFLDGIGFSNWNTVKTDFKVDSIKIDIIPEIIGSNIVADNKDEADIKINFSYNGQILKNYKVDKIDFITGYNSDVYYAGESVVGFKYNGGDTTDNSGYIYGKVTSLNGSKNLKYGLKITKGDKFNIIEGTTDTFIPPFKVNFELAENNIKNKILVGYENKAKLNKEKVNGINTILANINTQLKINSNNISIINGSNIDIDNSFHKFKIVYDDFVQDDEIDTYYEITGNYIANIDSKNYTIKNFQYNTNIQKVYKDGEIHSIAIQLLGGDKTANGKDKNQYQILFLDKDGIRINHIHPNIKLVDDNKIFNLNLDNNNYNTGFFYNTNLYSSNGLYKVNILSYKPIKNGKLKIKLSNLNYNGHYPISNSDQEKNIENINFQNVAELTMENKILKINRNNNIKVEYDNNIDLSDEGFLLTGYVPNCSSCTFIKGKTLNGNNFNTYNFDVNIHAEEAPEKVIYSGYYFYQLDGDKGTKKVYIHKYKEYSPILFVESGKIKIIGAVLTNKKLLNGFNYISTSLDINRIKSKLEKLYYQHYIQGAKYIKINHNYDIDISSLTGNTYVYKCIGNNMVNIKGNYNKSIRLFFLGCRININGNIKSNKGQMSIIAYSNNKIVNFDTTNGWDIPGNIFIKDNVKTIQSDIITQGSIFTYEGSTPTNVFIDRKTADSLKKQLYIRGKIFSKNTLGGGNKMSDGTYMIINGKRVNESELSNLKDIAQAYDITFWRNSFVKADDSYDTGDIAEYILNKYHCSGNKNTDKLICTTNLVIENYNK